MSIENLLDISLDDMNDMPSFEAFPNGAHVATITWEAKDINSKPSLQLNLKADSTQELVDPENDKPLESGAETQIAFIDYRNNEFAQGSLKEILKPLAAHFGTTGLLDTVTASEGAAVLIVTKKRWNKDKTQAYTGITNLQVI